MSAVVRTPVDDPAAWRGEDLAVRDDWVISLDPPLIAELDAALDQVEAGGIDALDIRKEDFPLPGFSAMREAILGALEGGLGFVLMRGLPVERWDSSGLGRTARWRRQPAA
jgi:hypothetical protein